MANLLDQASIVLTPTAYDNGKVLCAKPVDGSGDFDFSRNSAATRVNAQGLVEDVQILSSNLVQNGSFSQLGSELITNGNFSQQGSELVTNGDFATDSNWAKNPNWTISGGTANCDGTSNGSFFQSNVIQNNKQYLVTYTISNLTQGGIKIVLSGSQGILRTTNGTYTEYITSSTNPSGRVSFDCASNPIGSIDNVSVVEVGQDWTFTSGATLTALGARITHEPSIGQIIQFNNLVIGKNYKITYEITERLAGGLKINAAVVNSMNTSVGIHTKYFEADAVSLGISRTNPSGNDVTITNISLKEVGQDWSLDSGWNIGDDKAVCDGVGVNSLQQSGITTIGKNYKLTFDIIAKSSDDFLVISTNFGDTYVNGSSTSIGTNTFYITPTSGTGIRFRVADGTTLSVTNIKIIEITDDTNLPRINYEGFSYQDALGSEEIVNGDFATDSNWTKGTGWTISGGKAVAASVGSGQSLSQGSSIISGVSYKVTYTVLDFSEGGVYVRVGSSGTGTTRTANGTYTETVEASGNSTIYFTAYSGSTTLKIDNVSVKEVTGQEVVPDSGCGSWLWENQSTNLITYSEDFSNSYWTKSNASVVSGQSSPDGLTSGFKLVENTATSSHNIFAQSITPLIGDDITISCFMKKGKRKYGRVYSFEGGAGEHNAIFNLDTGVVQSENLISSSSITPFIDGWFRCTITYTTISTNGIQARFYVIDDALNVSYPGDGTSGIYIWGAQTEKLSYATSYIPTNGTSVTRNQDVCTNGGSAASINSTEGVLYFEGSVLSNDGTARAITIRKDGGNFIKFLYSPTSNRVDFVAFSSGALSCNITKVISNTTDNAKFGLKWKQNDFAFWINGVEVGQDLSGNTPLGMDKISFTNEGGTGDKFFGKTKALVVWKEVLSDEELTLLTTI